jgi:hypothetical protein
MESCSRFDSDIAPARRLSADVGATDAAAAPSLHRIPRAVPSLTSYKADHDAALEADMEVRKMQLDAAASSLHRFPGAVPSFASYKADHDAALEADMEVRKMEMDSAASSLHRFPGAVPSLASYKADHDAALEADMEVRKMELDAAAPSLHRFPRAVPSLASYKADHDAALEADLKVRKMQRNTSMAALNVIESEATACNVTTAFYYVTSNTSADLSLCRASLTELVILGADFALIAPQLKHLVNLQVLKIYYAANALLPEELADLKHITRLEMHGTRLYAWPAVLQRMPQLTNLTLSATRLYATLPPWLGKLHNLVHLDLSHNYLFEIGDEVGDLVNLQALLAPFSYVNSVSPRINRLTHLRHLDLRGSYWLRLPAALAELQQLESVQLQELEYSFFPCVPDAVRAMPLLANQSYFNNTPACEAVPRPIGYSQTRNAACLWDAYYGFWYKAACDGTLVALRLLPLTRFRL